MPNTDDSVLRLGALLQRLDALITSDSLFMRLAIAQHVPTLAFFARTSAAEIDGFRIVEKVLSSPSDYCSYVKDVDHSSITGERVLEALGRLGDFTR